MILTISIFYIHTTVNRLNDWMIASSFCKDIPLKIKEFIPEVKPNTKIYIYGIPHNYKGAYVYNNGFENSLRIAFNNKSLNGSSVFLLQFPKEMFNKRNFSNTYFFAFIGDDIFRIIFHPDKENYLLFISKKGKYFEISFKEYYELTEKITESYTEEDGSYPSIKQMEINEEIIEELIRKMR